MLKFDFGTTVSMTALCFMDMAGPSVLFIKLFPNYMLRLISCSIEGFSLLSILVTDIDELLTEL